MLYAILHIIRLLIFLDYQKFKVFMNVYKDNTCNIRIYCLLAKFGRDKYSKVIEVEYGGAFGVWGWGQVTRMECIPTS